MKDKPFLSVVMPIHEGAEWMAATLDSLASQASQGLEIIAIDSSPTNATLDILERYAGRLSLRIVERRDIGPWPTKTNLGVELAAADHVCILHQDDLWLPWRANAARRWLANWPEADLHLAPTLIIDRHGRRVGAWNCPLPADRVLGTEFLLERLLVQNFVSVPAPIVRRSAWLACGGMDDTLWYTADWDIWVKLGAAGSVVYHDEFTTAFRVHAGSLTVTGSRNAGGFPSQMQTVLDRYLDRIPADSRDVFERVARASIPRCLTAVKQRRAVALLINGDDARALCFRDVLRSIVRSVVGDDDFGVQVKPGDGRAGLPDTARERGRLVQTRHQHGQLHLWGRPDHSLMTCCRGEWIARCGVLLTAAARRKRAIGAACPVRGGQHPVVGRCVALAGETPHEG